MTLEAAAPNADARHATELRGLLRRANYTRDGIQALLGVAGDVLARPRERPVYLRRLTGSGALETLIRLFLLDEPVDSAEVERALAPTRLEALEALGVLGALGSIEREEPRSGGGPAHGSPGSGSRTRPVDTAASGIDPGSATRAGSTRFLRGLVRIVPHGDLYVASDLPEYESVHGDFVAGLHRPSITLADLTVRRPVRAALDVGTGCGIQALLAARHAERVVATDINERALAFARLNAALNGIANIEFRLGSFFEPAAGETFGLVVSNPPYVISPELEYLFRDSGLGRDRVSESLVRELPGFLEEGGFATITVSWIQDRPDPAARPRQWLEGNGCDAWILHTGLEDPLTTAANWNRDAALDEAGYAAAIDRWTTYFRNEGIEGLAYGAIVLRRRTAAAATATAPQTGNWVRSRELPNHSRVRPEAHMLRLFSGPDLSASLPDDDAFAKERLALVEGARIDTHLLMELDGWAEAAELELTVGLPFSAELDAFTALFLAQLDGRATLGEVLDEFARANDAPPDRVRASGVHIARELLEAGMAAPAAAPATAPASGAPASAASAAPDPPEESRPNGSTKASTKG